MNDSTPPPPTRQAVNFSLMHKAIAAQIEAVQKSTNLISFDTPPSSPDDNRPEKRPWYVLCGVMSMEGKLIITLAPDNDETTTQESNNNTATTTTNNNTTKEEGESTPAQVNNIDTKITITTPTATATTATTQPWFSGASMLFQRSNSNTALNNSTNNVQNDTTTSNANLQTNNENNNNSNSSVVDVAASVFFSKLRSLAAWVTEKEDIKVAPPESPKVVPDSKAAAAAAATPLLDPKATTAPETKLVAAPVAPPPASPQVQPKNTYTAGKKTRDSKFFEFSGSPTESWHSSARAKITKSAPPRSTFRDEDKDRETLVASTPVLLHPRKNTAPKVEGRKKRDFRLIPV